METFACSVRCVLMLAAATPVLRGQTMYRVEEIPPPSGELVATASSINDKGWILIDASHPGGNSATYVRKPDGDHLLPPVPGRLHTSGTRMFGDGRVLGISYNAQGTDPIPCTWNTAGSVTELRTLPGFPVGAPLDANGQQQIVGNSSLLTGLFAQPVIWQNHVLAPLPLPPGKVAGTATGITNSGVIIGYASPSAPTFEGFIRYPNGPTLSIGVVPGTDWSQLEAINESLVAVGSGKQGTASFGIRYENGVLTRIDGPTFFNWQGVHFKEINRAGVAVGWANTGGPFSGQFGIITYAGGFTALTWLVDPATPLDLRSVSVASSINDAGVIVGTAKQSFGQPGIAVLLTPLPGGDR